MSVILTAGKKFSKPKSAKPKKKKRPIAEGKSFNPSPPVSSERTTVWHWLLNEVPTTVMYSKENNEVWCNGEVLETVEGFDAEGDGGVIDFCICLDETESAHKARIQRIATGQLHSGIAYMLYVDGMEIPEHLTNSVTHMGEPSGGMPYYDEAPPYMDYDAYRAMYDGLEPPEGEPDVNGAYGTPPPPYYEDPAEYNGYNSDYYKKNQ